MTQLPQAYAAVSAALREHPRRWLVTGGAGFIGSHLVERLLELRQIVIVLDNLSTGSLRNIESVLAAAPHDGDKLLTFERADIRDLSACRAACAGVDHVLHQAALGSVPRSLRDPGQTHDSNSTGFLNVLCAARDASVKSVVYASSSSVYGDHPALPKVEHQVGNPLSPYAVTKMTNELYARVFSDAYGLRTVGLRYFNVFGPRQDPNGPYAAVMPRWFAALLDGDHVTIHGDGETSRDFCYVANVVQANILAATNEDREVAGAVFNVACGTRTSLNQLFELIRGEVSRLRPTAKSLDPRHAEPRPGDIRHSLADIAKAHGLLGYRPTHSVSDGLRESAEWYSRRTVGAAAPLSR